MLSTVTAAEILNTTRSLLRQHRAALHACAEQHAWISAFSVADLTAAPPAGPGMTPGDAQAVLDALADVNGEAQLYDTGTDSRNPPAGTVYGRSQIAVIGPQG